MELKGKTAIVTGAGRGIGEGIAKAVGREGANVVVNNRSMDAAEAVAGAIERDGGSAMAYQADVTNTDEITAMVDATVHIGEQKRHHPRRSSRCHGIASAHAICPSKPSDLAMSR